MGDYKVPRLSDDDVRCPNCGSPAILPLSSTMRGENVPRAIRHYQCARCGTEYKVRPQPPTIKSMALSALVVLVLLILLVVLFVF